jgi:hypothetical protein
MPGRSRPAAWATAAGLAAGLDVGANLRLLRGGHLRRGVVDDGERGRAGAQRVVGGHASAPRSKPTSSGGSTPPARRSPPAPRIVRGLPVQRILGQVRQDRRRQRRLPSGTGNWLASSRSSPAGHGPDVRKVRVHHRVAQPEEHAVVVRGCAGADLFLGPAILAVERVGAVGAAGVVKAQRAQAERFAARACSWPCVFLSAG